MTPHIRSQLPLLAVLLAAVLTAGWSPASEVASPTKLLVHVMPWYAAKPIS